LPVDCDLQLPNYFLDGLTSGLKDHKGCTAAHSGSTIFHIFTFKHNKMSHLDNRVKYQPESEFLNPPGGRPGPRPRFQVLSGSLGSILIFLKNHVILVKKKQKSTGCNRVLPVQPNHPVTLGFDFFYFFLNPAWFQLQVNPLGQTGFKTMTRILPFSIPCTLLPSPLVLVSS
jgi:hypothetical protein